MKVLKTILEWWYDLRHYPPKIELTDLRKFKKWYQRAKRGYADEDVWGVNSYLCEIIPPMLRKIKEEHYGCPGNLFDASRKNDECWKWKEILEEIAQGFEAGEALINHEVTQWTPIEGKNLYAFETDEDKIKQCSEKFNRGMELFKEYFFNLWD